MLVMNLRETVWFRIPRHTEKKKHPSHHLHSLRKFHLTPSNNFSKTQNMSLTTMSRPRSVTIPQNENDNRFRNSTSNNNFHTYNNPRLSSNSSYSHPNNNNSNRIHNNNPQQLLRKKMNPSSNFGTIQFRFYFVIFFWIIHSEIFGCFFQLLFF